MPGGIVKVTRRELLNSVPLGGSLLTHLPGGDLGMEQLKKAGYVVVTPEGPKDGGDFGPHTEGTKTSGMQEALDDAKAQRKDVYIAGGAMPKAFAPGAVYHLQETLRIPWMQDFRLDGGEYVLAYDKPTGDAVVIDSQMNCRFKFGLIIADTDGAVVRLKPETKGPDNASGIVACLFEFNAVVGAPFKSSPSRKGTGLVLDGSSGPIGSNRIVMREANACGTGVHLKHGCANNSMHFMWIHGCHVGLQVGDARANVSGNMIEAHIIGEGIEGSVGVRVFGQRNLVTLNVHQTAPGKNIVFETDAKDNLVCALNLPNGVTNNATTPTNRIITAWQVGFDLPTPAFPASGAEVVNRNPYPAAITILTAGRVSDWTLTDAQGNAQTVQAGVSAGQTLMLEPGDRIKFTYTVAPTWRWRGLS